MTVSPEERQFLLSQVNRLAERDLRALWVQAERLSDVEFAAFVIRMFPEVVAPYVEMAGQLAATWFEQSAPTSAYIANEVSTPDVEKLLKSARWALGGDGIEGLTRLQGTSQRAIFNGARETTLTHVEATNSRWARYASANACAFCRLLATRTETALYTSKESALRVVGRGKDFSTNFREDGTRKAGGQAKGVKARGSRKIGEKYHDNCHCIAVEVRDTQSYEVPEHIAEWQKTYREAWNAVPDGTSYDDNGVLKAVLAQWRQIDDAR